MERFTLNQKEWQRYQVITLLLEGRCNTQEAATTIGISERQTIRLKKKVQNQGVKGVIHGNQRRNTGRGLSEEVKDQISALAQHKYRGFNDTHLWEKLTEVEGFLLSRETLRKILREKSLPPARKRRPPKHRRRRPPRPQEGMLIQVDGSPHDWLEGRGHWLCLVGAIDDATGRVLWARFFPAETSEAYMHLIRGIITRYGIPLAFYSDRHSIFYVTRKEWTLEEELAGRQQPTQVGQVLERLGIELILANSPQAKGRVERLWNTFQDRLVSELRLAGVETLEEANRVLERFLEDYNRRFCHPALEPQSAFRKVPRGLDIDRAISFTYQATVGNDNTVRVKGRVFDIPPGQNRCSYARAKVMVHRLLNEEWRIYYQDRLLLRIPPGEDASKAVYGEKRESPIDKRKVCLASKPLSPKG